MAAAARLFVPALYGAEFQRAVPIVSVLALTLPMLTIATLCWTGMLSAGKASLVSIGLIATGVFNLIALYAGASLGGVITACWGSVLASVIAAVWWLVANFLRKK
jgi:O-antigen/teichoic acid export membrane protein